MTTMASLPYNGMVLTLFMMAVARRSSYELAKYISLSEGKEWGRRSESDWKEQKENGRKGEWIQDQKEGISTLDDIG